MATWHQRQAQRRAFKAGRPIVFWHETQWTVLSDPPGEMTSMMTFATEADAQRYVANCQARGERHLLILPPRQR